MKPVPLFGDSIQAYSAVVSAQRRLNCFYDPRMDQDKKVTVILRGTPGTATWITLPAGPIRGWWVVNDVMYVVAAVSLFSVTLLGVITFLGVLSSTTGRVEIKDNGLQLGIVDGVAGYTYTIATNTFAKITDVNFPNGATGITFLNGRFSVEVPGTRQYRVGQAYDALNWTPQIFGTKENDSSSLVAVEALNGTLILWGTTNIEFWQDTGSTPLPYQRINGTTQTWGLAATGSRALFDNTEVFLGRNPQGRSQVLILNGYVPVRISTVDIENIIGGFTSVNDAVALTYVIDGHPMYQITFPSGNRTFLYDGLTKLWQEVQTGLGLVSRHFGNYSIAFGINSYMSDTTTGNVYTIDPNSYTDNGTPIKRQVRTRHIRNDGNVFGVSELYLDVETGVGLQSGQGSDPMMMIQVSKNGGRTFGPERKVSMGKAGEYRSPRLITRRWGQAVDMVWQFTVTDPVKFTIISGSAVITGLEGSTM